MGLLARSLVRTVCKTSRRSLSNLLSSSSSPGFIFDIDGVLLRGESAIPAAKVAMKRLVDSNSGKFKFPTIFCTNASGLPDTKAKLLTSVLDVRIDPSQLVMAETPLTIMDEFHDKWCLVSGGGQYDGGSTNLAKSLGFRKVVSISDLSKAYPFLDWIDRSNWRREGRDDDSFPTIEAVVLLGEPVRWETNLQLITDVLLTDGKPNHWPPHPKAHRENGHLPVIAVNMDLQWVAKAEIPRFGHGTFMVCLENVYKKISGQDLQYTALVGKPSQITYKYCHQKLKEIANDMGVDNLHTIYAIGDNPASDIYGANLFNQTIASGSLGDDNLKCVSILLRSGVYQESGDKVGDTIDHGHRDYPRSKELSTPNYLVDDVNVALTKIFEFENVSS